MTIKELITKAMEAKERSHAPYSNFHVGSVVVMSDGAIYDGCNVEVATFAGTLCAERNAIFKAVSDGHKKVETVVVVGDLLYTYPCGICRQVIREFSDDADIIIAADEENYKVYKLSELLPHSFGPEDLEVK